MGGPRVVLMGPPGAGKSTVARALGNLLKAPVRDTDADIVAQVGKPIYDIFIDDGEEQFRAWERAAVAAALTEHAGVLALGGGAVLAPETQQLLEEYAADGSVVVFLDVSLAAAAPRLGFNRSRPLLVGNPRQQWQALMNDRRATYERLATLTVVTDGKHTRAIAKEIAAALGHTPGGQPEPAEPDEGEQE